MSSIEEDAVSNLQRNKFWTHGQELGGCSTSSISRYMG